MGTVTVLGGGSWGTALALQLSRVGHSVRLWGRDPAFVASLATARENETYLPGVPLPDTIQPTPSLADACAGSEMLVVVCPSKGMRPLAETLRQTVRGRPIFVSAAKGVEQGTHLTMTAILREVLGAEHASRVAVLSGPSFAREVAAGVPTAVTSASADIAVAERVQQLFNSQTFRVYSSTDVVGVEIGGAVKNVIAIAAGVSDGLGFGHNSRAALITRGLAEISRLALELGADRQTLAGLAGMGDLVLTCAGDQSRNRTVGLRLGRGESLDQIVASMKEVAEGVHNTRTVRELAQSVRVEMPITERMYELLYENKPPKQAVVELMTRSLRREAD
jgi:glycerol-3-phosphate dehydrogenase (NAD(P)+)